MTSAEHPPRELNVLSLQAGGWGVPASEDIQANARQLAEWTDTQIAAHPADLVVLPELSTTPYFCVSHDDRYFEWAEPIPGASTELFSQVARKHEATIVLPMFERGTDSRFYNSAAVIGPDGELVPGNAFGQAVTHYRKCHVPTVVNPPDFDVSEDYFFSPGQALPVFDIPGARIGVLICFDRWFPESWRMLTFGGAELVVVPMVAWGFVESSYLSMLISRAVENGLFVASCNRSADEELDGVLMNNFGRSVVISPDGTIIAEAPRDAGPVPLHVKLDLNDVERDRNTLPLLRYRREDLYGSPPWVATRA